MLQEKHSISSQTSEDINFWLRRIEDERRIRNKLENYIQKKILEIKLEVNSILDFFINLKLKK